MYMILVNVLTFFLFFIDTSTTGIYTYVHTRSLHDALPISSRDCTSASLAPAVLKVQVPAGSCTGAPMEAGKAAQPSSPSVRVTTTSSMDSVPSLSAPPCVAGWSVSGLVTTLDRKSTRLNSSH